MGHNLHIYENAENTSRAVAELIKEMAQTKTTKIHQNECWIY